MQGGHIAQQGFLHQVYSVGWYSKAVQQVPPCSVSVCSPDGVAGGVLTVTIFRAGTIEAWKLNSDGGTVRIVEKQRSQAGTKKESIWLKHGAEPSKEMPAEELERRLTEVQGRGGWGVTGESTFWNGFSQGELQLLASTMRVLWVPEKEHIFVKGEEADYFGVLLSGTATPIIEVSKRV
ncbi:hypothetical protein CYMTET_3702 [Cymbomonas tetramitiformis]|uniref:Cyclic nucleotide-binding domain-containing protein n=1 Tax=Cymbomonas tetramitiformis TaxID=36881 RepID=A0AAE0H2S4_9CHLO|nr:hypothetical protein CYMTET_3702 [Cymbomonas tetramitiformis]